MSPSKKAQSPPPTFNFEDGERIVVTEDAYAYTYEEDEDGGIDLDDVMSVLERRTSQSGLAEKAARSSKSSD